MSQPSEDNLGDQKSIFDRVNEILQLIRPALQADGGDAELVDVSEAGIVTIRFLGACVGCPSSNLTLQAGIEKNLKDRIPEVTAVRDVDAGKSGA